MSYLHSRRPAFIASSLLLATIIGGLAAPVLAVSPAPFVSSPVNYAGTPPASGPVGFTYAGNKFVGSVLDDGTGNKLLYSTNLTGGNVQLFGGGAPALAASFGLEHYVSASIGLGGFANGDVYVAAG